MSTLKTRFDQSEASAFVSDHLHIPTAELEAIANGEGSQAFFFDAPGGEMVLRVNSSSQTGFLKDQFAEQHYGSAELPIPKIIDSGEISEGVYFAISERSPGLPLDELPTQEIVDLVPLLIHLLDVIHKTKPVGEGYGGWDLKGDGSVSSWRQVLENKRDDKAGDDMITVDYFDPIFGDSIRDKITSLLDYCPEDRQLVHADIGFGNVIAKDGQITGVIDWEMSMYGDPLFDVAWLAYWDNRRDYKTMFREHYVSENRLPNNYDERIACYGLIIGVQSLSFFAKSEQSEKYAYAVERLQAIDI
jgi:hygromycin-B 4-O-kinase